MTKEERIRKNLNDEDYVKKLKEEKPKTFKMTLIHKGKPENYVRERYTSRGRRFYNPKSSIMADMNRVFKDKADKEILNKINGMAKDSEYYVELDCRFYMPIQKGDSLINSARKELGLIKPAMRPDIDNYTKLLLDVLHDVAYDDDARVTKLSGEKIYSLDPRTEVDIVIHIIKEVAK